MPGDVSQETAVFSRAEMGLRGILRPAPEFPHLMLTIAQSHEERIVSFRVACRGMQCAHSADDVMRTRLSRSIALIAFVGAFLAPSVLLAAAHDACAHNHYSCASISAAEECCCHTLEAPSTPPGLLKPSLGVSPLAEASQAPATDSVSEAHLTGAVFPHWSPPRAVRVHLWTLFSVLLV